MLRSTTGLREDAPARATLPVVFHPGHASASGIGVPPMVFLHGRDARTRPLSAVGNATQGRAAGGLFLQGWREKIVVAMSAVVTSLFSNEVLSRLERLRIVPRQRRTNRSRGEHLHGKGGTSTEFTDYRDYVAGDDVRYVDWNIFSRLNRPYLKLYRHEEEMHVVVLIDASSSMQSEGKFERAKQLGAAFGLMGLMNQERVSLYGCNSTQAAPEQLPPCTGRVSMRRLFQFVERLEGGGDLPVERAVDEVLKRHRGRGVCFVLSDFLTLGSLHRPLNLLFSSGLEISAIQVLGPSEINPELAGDVRFVDCETGQTLDVSSAGDLLGLYHEHRQNLEAELSQMCQQRSGRFLSLSSQDPLEWVLFDVLRRKGWVR